MAEIRTTSGGLQRFSNMFGGADYHSSNITPNSGVSTTTWSRDISHWGGTSGDICASSENSGPLIQGENGKKHWQINKWGTTHGHYLKDHVIGVQFKVKQSSDKGHAIFLERYGIQLQGQYAGSHFVDLGGVLPKTRSGTITYWYNFSSSIMNKLRGEYVIDEVRMMFSSEGGTGTRTTSCRVFDFQFKYESQSGGKQLIIPPYRTYGDRNQQNRIA